MLHDDVKTLNRDGEEAVTAENCSADIYGAVCSTCFSSLNEVNGFLFSASDTSIEFRKRLLLQISEINGDDCMNI